MGGFFYESGRVGDIAGNHGKKGIRAMSGSGTGKEEWPDMSLWVQMMMSGRSAG